MVGKESIINQKDKLDIILKLKKISNKELAILLGVSDSFISRLRDKKSNQLLKKMHIIAICEVLRISLNIFENDKINNKDKIEEFLKIKLNNFNIKYQNGAMLKKLIGNWYVYSHAVNKIFPFWRYKIEIFEDYTLKVYYAPIDKLIGEGSLCVIRKQTLIAWNVFDKEDTIYCIFDNNIENLFFSFMNSKNYATQYNCLELALFSKEELDDEELHRIFDKREKCQIVLNDAYIQRISFFIKPYMF